MRQLWLTMALTAVMAVGAAEPEGDLRDHCWMWGHDSGVYDGTGPSSVYNLPLSEPISMPDACAYMGIPNVCAVTWKNPDAEYLKPFAKMKRVSWVVCGAISVEHPIEERYYALRDRDMELLRQLPNLVGLDLDDYYHYNFQRYPTERIRAADGSEREIASSGIGHANLLDLRRRTQALGRPVEFRVVLYIDRMQNDELFRESLSKFDVIMAWTWTGSNLAKLRENYRRVRALAPTKRILMGIYMWDFGARKPLDMEFMRSQLDTAHELYHSRLIDGFVFHCTPLVNKRPAIAAVEYARQWIAEHGGERRRSQDRQSGASRN